MIPKSALEALKHLVEAIEYAHATGSSLHPDVREVREAKDVLLQPLEPTEARADQKPLAWLVKNAPDSEGNDIPYTNWSRVRILMDEGYECIPLYSAPPLGSPGVDVDAMLGRLHGLADSLDTPKASCDGKWVAEKIREAING